MKSAIILDFTNLSTFNKIYSKLYFYIMTVHRNHEEVSDIQIDLYSKYKSPKFLDFLTDKINYLNSFYNKNISLKHVSDITQIQSKYDELYIDEKYYNENDTKFDNYAEQIKKYTFNLQECDEECKKCGCYKQLGFYNSKNRLVVERIAPHKLTLFNNINNNNNRKNSLPKHKVLILNDFSYFTDKINGRILSDKQTTGGLLRRLLETVKTKMSLSETEREEFDDIFARARIINAINCISNVNNLSPAVTMHTNFGKNGASYVKEEILAFKPDYILVFGSKAFSSIKLDERSYITTFSDLRGRVIEDSVCGHKCKIFGTLSPNDVFVNCNLSRVFIDDVIYLTKSLLQNYDVKQNNIIEQDKYNYSLATNRYQINEIYKNINALVERGHTVNVAIDIETNSLKTFKGLNESIDPRITVISLCFDKKIYQKTGYKGRETVLIPYEYLDDATKLTAQKLVRYLFKEEKINKFLHNAAYDLTMMERLFKTNGNIALSTKNLFDTTVYMNSISEEHVKGFKTLKNLSVLYTDYGTYYFNLNDYKEKFSRELNSYIKEFNKITVDADNYTLLKNIINQHIKLLEYIQAGKITDFKSFILNFIEDKYVYYLLKNAVYSEKKIKIEKVAFSYNTFFNYVLFSILLNDRSNINLFTEKNSKMNTLYRFAFYFIEKFFTIDNIKTFLLKKEKLDMLSAEYNENNITLEESEKYELIGKFINNFKSNIINETINKNIFNKIGFDQNILKINYQILKNLISFDDNNFLVTIKPEPNYGDFDKKELYAYTAFDAKATLEGGLDYLEKINKGTIPKISSAIVNEVLRVIVSLQTNGIKINKDKFYQMKSEYEEKLKKIEDSILTNKDYNKYFEELEKKGILKEEFNIRSSDHIVKLFEVLRVDGTGILSKSAKDNTIMDESTLEKIKGLKDNDTYKENNNNNINNDTKNRISHASNIAENILEYRKTNKIYSTYLEGLLKNGLIDDNFFCYPNYNAIGTRTGRFSSSNPNLQNIPSEVKGLYISRFKDDDNITGRLIQADYSQIELRVAAMYSECKKLIEAFKSGEDIHMATARLISPTPYLCKDISSLSDENKKKLIEIYKKHTNRYSLSDEEVLKNIEEDTKHIRRIAKTINFGIIYGISHYSIAKRLGIDETEAETFKDNYMKAYPEIKIYMDDTQETARKTGCVGTYFGRIRNVRNAKYFNILYDTLSEECKDDEELRKYFNKENMGYFRSAKNRAERQAINAPIQSTASDFTLLSLISLNHFLSNSELTVNDKTYRPVICGTVHDSIIIDCPDRKDDNEFTKNIIKNVKKIMSDPIKYFLDNIAKNIKYINDKEIKTLEGIRNRYAGNDSNCVPIEAEVEVGDNWKDVSSDVENVLNIIFPEASESEDPEF